MHITKSQTSKGMHWHLVFSLYNKSHHVIISCKESFTAKQEKYVYSKCKNEGIIGTEEMYECEGNDKEKSVLNLIPRNALCLMISNYTMPMLRVLK